jgi:hypothetical protein
MHTYAHAYVVAYLDTNIHVSILPFIATHTWIYTHNQVRKRVEKSTSVISKSPCRSPESYLCITMYSQHSHYMHKYTHMHMHKYHILYIYIYIYIHTYIHTYTHMRYICTAYEDPSMMSAALNVNLDIAKSKPYIHISSCAYIQRPLRNVSSSMRSF